MSARKNDSRRSPNTPESTPPPDPAGTVTRWIGHLKGGDQEAARQLWDRYFHQLVRLARSKRRGLPHVGAHVDEEDAALSALNNVFQGAADGKYPDLGDRDELWRLLAVVAARKVLNQSREGRRLKRGGDRVRILGESGREGDSVALAEAIGPEPTPEFAALMEEQYRLRLEALGDDDLRCVAVWRLEGDDVEEIAARLGCGTRTVRRRLERIRQLWLEEQSG
jgi:DNA-directed RNA polymerase specialized sigma24 family protein